MSGEKKSAPPAQTARWTERDEIQRLDFVAGVVAPTSLAGCVACAALIATGHLVDSATYALGAAGLTLLGCASIATLSLAGSPLRAIQDGKDLEEVIDTKRSRTNWALAGLVLSVILGFGLTAMFEAAGGGQDDAKQKGNANAQRSGAHHEQRGPGSIGLHDDSAGQDGDKHHRQHQSRPMAVDLRDEVVHRSSSPGYTAKNRRVALLTAQASRRARTPPEAGRPGGPES